MFCGRKRHLREKLLALYGSNPLDAQTIEQTREDMEKIRVYYDEYSSIYIQKYCLKKSDKSRENKTYAYVDEITWDDLEMDEVFLRINQTKSYVGEQVLYKRLHEVDTGHDWEQ